jgi:hypothetical protein
LFILDVHFTNHPAGANPRLSTPRRPGNCTANLTLYAALNQGHNTTPPADIEEEPYQDFVVYNDCEIPLDVVSGPSTRADRLLLLIS